MIFKPFYRYETGCASYLFGCGGLARCAVVDPIDAFIEEYVAFADAKGMRITHVLETHVHSDHRSAGRALAGRVGAAHGLHRSAAMSCSFEPLADGQEIDLGNTKVQVLHTPGHTPESVCYVVKDLRRGPEPWFVLTGDTLFVGAVGRPDRPGRKRADANELFDSIHEKLLTLPETLEVYPGHFSGSVCGVGMNGKPSSTLAFERRFSPMLSMGREDFVSAVSDAPPESADMQAIIRQNQGRDAMEAAG